MAGASANKLRRTCSFPYLLLSCFNFTLFILSAASLAPTIILKSPPTSFGFALVLVSSMSLFSSFLGFYSHLTRFCFVTHVSLLIASSAAQLLAILALFTKERWSLSMVRSPRDPREAMVLVRLECGILVVMFVMEMGVLGLTYGVHCCRVREYQGMEAEKDAVARRRSRSRRMARVAESSMANADNISQMKGKELESKCAKTDFDS